MLRLIPVPIICTALSFLIAIANQWLGTAPTLRNWLCLLGVILLLPPLFSALAAPLRWHRYIRQREYLRFGSFLGWIAFTYIATSVAFATAYLHAAMAGLLIQGPGNTCLYQPGNFWLSAFDALYFSVVTGTSLGYGDFLPVHPAARIIAMLNITFGPLLLVSAFTIAVTSKTEIFTPPSERSHPPSSQPSE